MPDVMASDKEQIYKVSAEVPDWSRERKPRFRYNPGRALIASIRTYQRWKASGNPLLRALLPLQVLRHRFWTAVSGADIPINTQIAGGLVIPHPNGIVIHSGARIGPNCMIFQQVTLAGEVVLEGHVDIGAGAKIMGPLTIGKHSVVGANAVVTRDVPENSVAMGIPAEFKPRRGRPGP